MPEIIPRWEWRWFGPHFGSAAPILAAMTPSAVQESSETYLLSGAGDNVKVRDALMDIKVLREVSPDGLEQWTPVMKAGFPLPATDATKVFEALRLTPPSMRRENYTLEQFIEELAVPSGHIRAISVQKRRARYRIDGCSGEVTDVVVDGRPTRTIAVESEDGQAVIAAVRRLGLRGYTNINYPRGLAALVDGRPSRYAVIDVGTNSIKFHVAEQSAAGVWRTIVDRAEITRLGEGLADTKRISEAALDRTVVALSGMVAEARKNDVLAIVAVGTAGLRIAANSAQVLDAMEARAGIRVEVISGEDEARLAYLAARSSLGLADGSMVVFDTGGGSTQFTFGRGAEVQERFSLDIGAVRYTEQFGLDGIVTKDVLGKALAALSTDFARLDGRPAPDALAAMGGATTNIAAVKHGLARYDPDIIQGTVLERAEIDRQIELYRSMDADARRRIVGLQPKRAEVILAGACILRTVMEKLGKRSLVVSDRGLRHGVLAERFEG
jgi:exopolyphosphatase / guanosine-5'-triphosphate,3'-diphosphate pyrophosphatase